MNQVSRHHNLILLFSEAERHMPIGVTGGRQNPDMVAELKVIAHQISAAPLHDGQHAVPIRRVGVPAVGHDGTGHLPFAEHIAGIREGWNPFTIDELRIPAHMVAMQVRAHHKVDICCRQPGRGQCTHVGVIGLQVPLRTRT